jgi:hypothetical protein|nr:MAG TPA: Pulmonary surfactant-associated protein D, c-type lectin, alpha-helical coiled [Caudoviricetes sp.]
MALKNVVIGYAKGDKGDKGDTGERGATGQTGPQGESGNIADAAITDTQGLDVAKGAKTTAQKLFDAIADRIVNKLVTNDTLTTKLADYLLKSAMSSTNINSTTNVPTSALVYSLMQDVNNNLSNAGIPTVKKITDLYAIKKSGFYYYDAGATNAPMSSRGGMIVANYLSDSWISLTVVPYALSKKYTNTKYNNTWVGWAESATKNDLLISASGTGPTDWTALETVENMPFKIWNVTKASTSKGAPAGCYDYGTLIALVATATGDRWRNTLIYLPDNNNNVGNKVYVRSGISTKWLAISGTDVNSVS